MNMLLNTRPPFRSRRIAWSLRSVLCLVSSLVLGILASANLPPAQAQLRLPPTASPVDGTADATDAGIYELYFDRQAGTLTLYAEDASRLEILTLLREKYGVDVVVPELEDGRVSARLDQVRLDEALRRILPEGARFHFDAGEAEIDLGGRTDERRGLRAEFPSHAPPKGQGREPERDVMKLPPEKETRGRPDGDVVKAEAESIKVPLGEGPKKGLEQSYPGWHGRVGLHLVRDGGAQVTDYERVEGELVRGDRLAGNLIYAVYVGGSLAQVASLPDPFELRSYTEEGPHSHLEAGEADIRLALPDFVAEPEALRQTTIALYRLGDDLPENLGAPLPQELTPQTFERFRPYLSELGKVSGEDIIGARRASGRDALAGGDARGTGGTDGSTDAAGSTTDAGIADGLTAMDHHIPVTELLRSGSNGGKRNLVIIGDGFQADDQAAYNTFVDSFVMNGGVFRDDALRETMNAFNILRVNVDSTDQGVTQVDSKGKVTTARSTALDFRFSGDWNRCWMEWGPNSGTLLNGILNHAVPQRDYVFIVLNEPGFGGCAYGNVLAVTTGVGWTVGAHEMGHMVGALGDEYVAASPPETYTGGEPGAVNLTKNTDRATLKWREFVDPNTPLPTKCGDVTDMVQDVGAFEGGAGSYNKGIYRPTCDSRMRSNSPANNPVGYKNIHTLLDPVHDFDFDESYVGDFNGDGKGDVVVHNANSLALYVSTGSTLEVAWVATGEIPLWDDFMAGDEFYVGDFDGDGKDDLFVVNFGDWVIPYFALLRSNGAGFDCIRRFDQELPGWDDMKPGDEFFVADFNGDGRDDIEVFNASDWSMAYFELLRSTGGDLAYAQRYDGVLPGWDDMKKNDRFYVADFDADGRDDLYVFNGQDWSVGYLEMLRSTGGGLAYVVRYDEELPGWDDMKPGDEFYVADFSGDGREDLYAVNTKDWSMGYLELLRSRGNNLAYSFRYDGVVPGWDRLEPGDRFYAADVNGDKLDDLYVYNATDWDSEYLGILRSGGRTVSGSWQKDWVNSWNLGENDQFLVANFNGGAGWDDLFVRNHDWFGLLRSYSSSVGLTMINPNWIHNHRYHNFGWW